MATASSKNLEEQDVASSSKKPRRSVIRSISLKRSKKTKMDEVDNDQAIDEALEVDAGRSFGKRGGAHAMMSADDEDEEISELDGTGPSSKKRKRFGVWKAMKRIFRRKNGKGSKSFTAGDSNSPHAAPQRSISDPNLGRRRIEDRPELAPLEQVNFPPPVTEAETSFPKKALSHDSLMLELRSKQGKGTPPIKPKRPAVVSPGAQALNWKVSPSSNPESLLPGLNVSRDKIRVAPRHRRAPTRRGVASARHGGRDITDNIIPRSKSVGAASQANVVTKPQETTDFKELMQSLRSREQLTFETKKHEIKEEAIPEESKVEKKVEKIESVSDDNDIGESNERDIAVEESHVSLNKELKITEGEESAKEDKISDMEIVPVVFEVGTTEKQTEVLDKVDDQETAEEALKELKYSEHEPVPLSTTNSETNFSDSDGVVVKSESETVAEPDRELMRERTTENKDDTGMPSATIMEPVSNKDDESMVKVVAELNPVELVEPEPESESAPKLAPEREQKPESELEAKPAPEPALEPATEPEQDHEPEPAAEPEQDHEPATEPEQDHEPEPEPKPESELEPEREPELELKPKPKFEPVLGIISRTGREGSIEDILKPTAPAPPEPISAPVPAEDLDKTLAQAHPEQQIDPRFSCDQETSESNLSLATHDVNIEKPKSPEVVKTSPVRSKRLKIETPEKVFQKPIMAELRIKEKEDEEKSDEPGGVQRRRIQSVNARIITRVEEDQSKDDSSAGVARLTQAFERSARSKTISFGERRKRPDVFPKPKIPPAKAEDTMNDLSFTRSLGRNYRFPVTAKKSLETSSKENMAQATVNRTDDTVEIVDKVFLEPNEITEKSKTVLMSPTKKPKTLPKPKMNKEAKPDGKENVKGESMSTPIRNGNAKVSEREEKKDGTPEAAMPSFWARRNIFSPNLAAENSTTDLASPGSPEKTKTKEVVKPLIQLKTDTCAVCGSKVYQMEKFKVKDNIVHRNCIKCSVCKRLLSVGNFIMSKNKIYCKPHEPRITITLTT